MNNKIVGLVVAGMMLGTTAVQAEESGMGLGVGAHVSTLGYGLDLSKSITDNFSARVGFNTYSFSDTEIEDDIQYDLDLDWQTVGVFADWHPFASSFRLTLGYFNNGNEISMAATPSGTYTIGDVTYNASEVGNLTGSASFGNGLFYGIGWGNAAKGKGFGFMFEAGILQQDVSLSLQANGPITDPTSD